MPGNSTIRHQDFKILKHKFQFFEKNLYIIFTKFSIMNFSITVSPAVLRFVPVCQQLTECIYIKRAMNEKTRCCVKVLGPSKSPQGGVRIPGLSCLMPG